LFRVIQFAEARSLRLFDGMNIAHEILRNDCSSIAFADIAENASYLSYGDVSKLIDAIAAQLCLQDFSPSERVAVTTPRGKDGLLAFLAISSYAICCPLDPRLLGGELASALRDLDVVAVIDATGEQRIADIAGSLAIPVRNLRFSDLSLDGSTRVRVTGSAGANDIALLLQTSGTTSKPKHVALTHSNVLAAAKAIGASYLIEPSDLCINPMPHHHVHGLISAGISSLVAGAAQFCAPSFAPAEFDKALQRLSPTWFTGSPAFHLGLLDYYRASDRGPQCGSLRFIRSSSAPFPASAIEQYEALFGVPLLENYGMTETASTICSNLLPPRLRKRGSVGCAIGAEIRVAGGEGREVEAEGEILIRGPSVITKYASGESGPDYFADGWLRTGDVGRIDEDGCLFILGRTKELIKRGGHSVYPLEVDSAIQSHPGIAEAISFSLEHPTLGEELVAAFVPRNGSLVDGDGVRRFLEEKLSSYKIPSAILRVTEIPKNSTGKTARRSMRDAFAGKFAIQKIPAASKFESELLEKWRSVTSRADLGVTDNVFVHGADPIRARRICDEMPAANGRKLTLKDLIRNPTVRQQALLLSDAGGQAQLRQQQS